MYQRSLEQQERSIYQRKQAVKDALASGQSFLNCYSIQFLMASYALEFDYLELSMILIICTTGKDLPTELRKDAIAMRKDLAFDAAQEEPAASIDYEYARAGIRDPKIVVTTSRDPSSKLLQFAKVCRTNFSNQTCPSSFSHTLVS